MSRVWLYVFFQIYLMNKTILRKEDVERKIGFFLFFYKPFLKIFQ
jgi:hypothetical protein